MNAQLKHRIAAQRGARKTKIHAKLLIADRFRERARSRDAIAGRGAYLLQDAIRLSAIPSAAKNSRARCSAPTPA
jgi:hypothetical protein